MSKEKLVRNAQFWYASYLRHATTADTLDGVGDTMRANDHRRVAQEMLDWYFDLVDRIATLQSTVEEA
jgi:hypothetical protein